MRYVADRHPEGRFCVKDVETGEVVSDKIHKTRDAQELAEQMNEDMAIVLDDLDPGAHEDATEFHPESYDEGDDLPDEWDD